ncbi:MAG: PorV/PorQ family protein [Bacteroidetes bacterium]|nr:PorV/PorQ family protein [Bacteroidota bacterium]
MIKNKILISILLIPVVAFSQGSSRGASSLKLPTTPFIGATGNSFVADPSSLQSLLSNPSNIAGRESYGVIFSHTEWMIPDIHTEYLSIAAPFSVGNFAFSIGSTAVDDISIYGDQPGNQLGTFNSQSTFFQLTYGSKITDDISIGIAPKYIYEKIFIDETTGWGIDLGALYTPPVEGVVLGVSLVNLGSLSAFRNEKTDLPSCIRLGGTYSTSMDVISIRVAAAYSSELSESVDHVSLGSEAVYNDIISVRLGYETGYETRSISAGIGLCYSIVVIDYAYIPGESQWGNSHIAAISFIF